jgi:hypothetical protein
MGSQEGTGPQTDKTPAAKSLTGQFFGIAFYQSNLSTGGVIPSVLKVLPGFWADVTA